MMLPRTHPFLLALTLLTVCTMVKAQGPELAGKPPDPEALFNRAAARHKQELADLRMTRGLSVPRLNEVSAKSLAALLSSKPGIAGAYFPKTAVLFYSHEEGALNIWLLDANGIKAHSRTILSQEQLSQVVSRMRDSLRVDSLQAARAPRKRNNTAPKPAPEPKPPIQDAFNEATTTLIPPSIATALRSIDHLIVVPVLGVGTVPFPVLQPFGPNSSLIDTMSISLAPSLFDIGHEVNTWKHNFSSPLIVGNPLVAPDPEWVIPSLPGAELEAIEVAKALNAKPLLGRYATRQEVLKRMARSDLLYFAAHGVASAEDPLSGSLLLSGSTLAQGKINASEVQQTRLPDAELVVLSACQTGLGRVHDAGVIGLARAFQIAGAKRVMMTLWSVNDQATNELMQAFIKNVRSDIPSEALRKAMLETRKKRPNPAEWASFVLFGTPR